jgi:four helix bundle protein
MYGLTAQLRKARVSVEANIAEGAGRGRPGQFYAFLEIAAGSISEADCLLELCRDLGYLDRPLHAELERMVIAVRKMLFALSEQVRQKSR